jgi:hypothetical protein
MHRRRLHPHLAQACIQLGVNDALVTLSEELAAQASGASDAWQTWTDLPAYLRREIDPRRGQQLDDARRRAQAEFDAFVRNPLAALPVQLAMVPATESPYPQPALWALATDRGPHVAVLVLEVASA